MTICSLLYLGRSLTEVLGAESYRRAQHHIEQAKRGEDASFVDTVASHKGTRWLSTEIVPDFDDKRRVRALVMMSHDITEARQRELELASAKLAAEQASRAKGEFLANMSHEIRTPLNAVIGFAELLERTQVDTQQARYLESIKSGGKTLLNLINDILDLSKIEAGKLSVQAEPVLVRPIFEDIVRIFEPKARGKGLALGLQIAPDLPNCLVLDDSRIRQVLFNLLGNAIKFTHQGSIALRLGYQRQHHQADQLGLQIEVADTGIGIPEEQQEKIFGSFEVLIVDDSATDRELLAGLLAHSGLELTEARGGAQALELCKTSPPELVLMDIRMPGMDGFEASCQIKSLPGMAETPIIALTASVGLTEFKLNAGGIDGYLTKPVRALALAQELKRFLPEAAERAPRKAEPRVALSKQVRDDLERQVRPLWRQAARLLLSCHTDDSVAGSRAEPKTQALEIVDQRDQCRHQPSTLGIQ